MNPQTKCITAVNVRASLRDTSLIIQRQKQDNVHCYNTRIEMTGLKIAVCGFITFLCLRWQVTSVTVETDTFDTKLMESETVSIIINSLLLFFEKNVYLKK